MAREAVTVDGLAAIEFIEGLPPKAKRAASMALNAAVKKARTLAAKDMERRINFPRGYLTGTVDNAPQGGRLKVVQYAKPETLSATLRGRDRPTSLARFVVGGAKVRKKGDPPSNGVMVEVVPGKAKRISRAFVRNLRNNNKGLAVRSEGRPKNALMPKEIAKNLWLLYSMSVDQTFISSRENVKADVQDYLEREYARLLELDLK